MSEKGKASDARELLEGALRKVAAGRGGTTDGDTMRAALALAVLLGEVSGTKSSELRKIINAETD